MSETLLTVKEAARRLAVGRTTIYELIAKHELVAIRIGRARRIPESALEAWIAQQITDEGGYSWQTADSTTPAGIQRSGRPTK